MKRIPLDSSGMSMTLIYLPVRGTTPAPEPERGASDGNRSRPAAKRTRGAPSRGAAAEGGLRVVAPMHDLGTGRVRLLEN